MFVFFLGLSFAETISVKVVKTTDGVFKLIRGGQDFFIKGGGGNQDFTHGSTHLKQLGGNSIRTWGSGEWAKALDYADAHDLTVCCGYSIDASRTAESYKSDIEQLVKKYKSRSSVLLWGIGNEQIGSNASKYQTRCEWTNTIAGYFKSLDPDHPTICVVAEINDDLLNAMTKYMPNIDIFGINSYSGCPSLGQRMQKSEKPYVVTEFGTTGWWDTGSKTAGTPNEPISTDAAKHYAQSYEGAIEKGAGPKKCLGSYAFLWGHKYEQTETWFGMFLSDGSRLGSVEAIATKWNGGTYPANHVPKIKALTIEGGKVTGLPVGSNITVSTSATDDDGDTLTWSWILYDYPTKANPPKYPDAIHTGDQDSKVTVTLPKAGKFLLYAFVRDGQGNAAYANRILTAE